jgi:hypothetical protein
VKHRHVDTVIANTILKKGIRGYISQGCNGNSFPDRTKTLEEQKLYLSVFPSLVKIEVEYEYSLGKVVV